MFCPECEGEYREGFTECASCQVPLVPKLSQSEAKAATEDPLVDVFASHNAALLPLAKSILRAAQIEFSNEGEGLQDLFALGRMGLGFNPALGPARLLVAEKDVQVARELLEELADSEDRESEPTKT